MYMRKYVLTEVRFMRELEILKSREASGSPYKLAFCAVEGGTTRAEQNQFVRTFSAGAETAGDVRARPLTYRV
jgi:hypothetical protein